MAKPSMNRIDPYQLVIDSLLEGPKKPAEIEKYIYEKAIQRYEELYDERYSLSEEETKRWIRRNTIKLRYIERILRDLKNKEEVAQEKPLGKYFLTGRMLEKPKFVANILGERAIAQLNKHMNALLKNPFVNLDDDNLEEGYLETESLFRFANNVGALVTYVMLDAMNPDNMKDLDKGSKKDESVRERISNAIDIDRIFREFCKLEVIKRGQAVYNHIRVSESEPPEVREKILELQRRRRHYDPDNPKWSRYEMDKDNFQKAMKAFSQAYSNPYELFERVKREMPQIIQGYKKSYIESVKRRRAAGKIETSSQ